MVTTGKIIMLRWTLFIHETVLLKVLNIVHLRKATLPLQRKINGVRHFNICLSLGVHTESILRLVSKVSIVISYVANFTP